MREAIKNFQHTVRAIVSLTISVLGDAPSANLEGENWYAGRCEIEALLPVGYSAPTPPECTELQRPSNRI